MALREQLEQANEGFKVRVPAEAQADILRQVKELQHSGSVFGLSEGDQAPNFTLDDPLGGQVTLYSELAKGAVVLTFYRGGWCPFCNIQLRAYQQVLPEIQKLGGQLIAISPQSSDNSLSQREKQELAFHVLSDPNGRVADSYKLLFEIPDYLQHTYEHTLKLNLAAYNQSDRWLMPVPATYVIDTQGIVRSAYVDPDFMKRIEPQDIIDQLKKL